MRHVKLPETDKEHVKLLECLHKRFVAGLKMPLEFMQTPQPFNGRDAQASRPVAMHKHHDTLYMSYNTRDVASHVVTKTK